MTPLPNNHYAIEVPEGSTPDTSIANGNGLFIFHPTKPIGTATRIQLPPGSWEIVSLASEIRDQRGTGGGNSGQY